jgi:hypothetical protein
MKLFDTDLKGFLELQNIAVEVRTHMKTHMEALSTNPQDLHKSSQ